MRRQVLIGAVLLVLLLAAVCLSAAGGRAQVLSANDYQALGCASISGWDWMRATDSRVTWTFRTSQLQGASPSQVYLNFAGLITNGVNGGAGYDATLTFYVSVPDTQGGKEIKIATVNPFRPQQASNSGGVGYSVYGHSPALPSTLVQSALKKGSLKVMLVWGQDSVYPVNRHIAVKRDALSIGYAK
jgi:hypothetical protein